MSSIRTRWAAIGAAIAVTLGAGAGIGMVNATADSGERPVYVPINPCRLMDTRAGANNVGPRATPLGEDETITVQARGSNGACTGPSAIPSDAVGVMMNVTALRATGRTFLTFWGSGANPGTANLNPDPGEPPTPNSVSTPLSASGSFELFNAFATVEVVIDVNGYYVDHNHDDRYDTSAEVDTKVAAVDARISNLDIPSPGRRFGRQITSLAQIDTASDVIDLVVGANGLVTTVGRAGGEMTVITCLSQGCLLPAASTHAGPSTGTSASITNGMNGAPVMSYAQGGVVTWTECDSASCATAEVRLLDTGVIVDGTSIAVRPSGNPLIAVFESNIGDLKLLSCSDPSCATFPTDTTVESAGFVGRGVSLTVGADGLGTMSYKSSGLAVARCTSDECTSITRNVVDPIDVYDTSLAIGVDGNPVIAYSDNENDELRLAVCNDPACATATIKSLDPAGSPLNLVGRDNAIAIDADGNPVVSYIARESAGLAGELRLVRCDDPACSSWAVSVIDDDEPTGSSLGVLPDGSLVVAFNRHEGTVGISDNTSHLAFVSPASHTPGQSHP